VPAPCTVAWLHGRGPHQQGQGLEQVPHGQARPTAQAPCSAGGPLSKQPVGEHAQEPDLPAWAKSRAPPTPANRGRNRGPHGPTLVPPGDTFWQRSPAGLGAPTDQSTASRGRILDTFPRGSIPVRQGQEGGA